jgi:peptidoglycan/xylan/chitin deacetylase (PgdA/CDA1 family)
MSSIALLVCLFVAQPADQSRLPIPNKLVVLTFDDSVKSHYTVVRPLLKKYGFGATFFITEGFDFPTNKQDYMRWEEIAELHRDGFEIGNHTRDHVGVSAESLPKLKEQLTAIQERCREHEIPPPVSFAYPGNKFVIEALPVLKELGFQFARRGGSPEYSYDEGRGIAYEPGLDHPLLIPTAGDARPDWELQDLVRAVEQARHGRIAVLQFHGVPDNAHPWVNTSPEKFEMYLRYLASEGYTAIAVRDLAKYVDPTVAPNNPQGVIQDRQAAIAGGKSRDDFRPPADDADLRYWLENMVWRHRFSPAEIGAATGLPEAEITRVLHELDIRPGNAPPRGPDDPLLVLPYPGGRHPRIGFLDGAIRPQRETKVSIFTPWDETAYVVADIPEAIWNEPDGRRELFYLAHTHIPTMWDRQGIELPRREWEREASGLLRCERVFPNTAILRVEVRPERSAVRMTMELTNRSEQTLRGLTVQNCVMLKGAPEFAALANDNKTFRDPYVACRSTSGNRWVITAWENCQRAWANPPCPCMHSDPKFADLAPGESSLLQGWLSFYEGTDLDAELQRIERTGWRD